MIRRLTPIVVLATVLPAACAAVRPSAARAESVSVTALSRGKGVPPAARDALRQARALLQDLQRDGGVTRLDEIRLGLEGETRLCAEFKDAGTARATRQKLQALAHDVDLLTIAEEPCPKTP